MPDAQMKDPVVAQVRAARFPCEPGSSDSRIDSDTPGARLGAADVGFR